MGHYINQLRTTIAKAIAPKITILPTPPGYSTFEPTKYFLTVLAKH